MYLLLTLIWACCYGPSCFLYSTCCYSSALVQCTLEGLTPRDNNDKHVGGIFSAVCMLLITSLYCPHYCVFFCFVLFVFFASTGFIPMSRAGLQTETAFPFQFWVHPEWEIFKQLFWKAQSQGLISLLPLYNSSITGIQSTLPYTRSSLKGIFQCQCNPWSNTPWHWVRHPLKRSSLQSAAYEVLATSEMTAR